MGDRYAQQYFQQVAPIAGQVSAVQVNANAASLDLSTVGQTAVAANDSLKLPSSSGLAGGIQRFVTFTASNCNVGVLFGASNGAVTGNNAPNTANNGISGNVNGPGACYVIGAGQEKRLWISTATRWIGYIAQSGSGALIITVSSEVM